MRAYLPPAMAAMVARHEAAEQLAAELAEAAREDDRVMAARQREHLDHVHEAATGYTAAELHAYAQARTDALGAIGWDPSAPLGTPQHPEPLIDGASLASMSNMPAVQAAATRYEAVTGLEAELARHEAGRAEWDSPRFRRIRRQAELAELQRSAGRPAARPAPAPPALDPADPESYLPPQITRTAPPLDPRTAPLLPSPDWDEGAWRPPRVSPELADY
jgi:hypothetical protein